MDLKNKVVLITGAFTERGKAKAMKFSKEGTLVVLCARIEDVLNNP